MIYKDICSTQNANNYKVVCDPEINKKRHNSRAPIIEYEKPDTNVKDPRLDKMDYDRSSLLYNTLFNIIEFSDPKIKQQSPQSTVLISNISPLSSESQIITVLSVYGKVNHIEIIRDPATGGPLGSAKVQFDDLSSAHRAINHGNGRRVMISDSITIELDSIGKNQ